MKCKICDRNAENNNYCKLHAKAYANITQKHALWEKALGISWKEYLSKIADNPLTGEYAKEVAKNMLKEEEENVA
ncbi:MAG: hypothetical protein QXJ02_01900 [Candidatus Bathyarchaeia archaeon]